MIVLTSFRILNEASFSLFVSFIQNSPYMYIKYWTIDYAKLLKMTLYLVINNFACVKITNQQKLIKKELCRTQCVLFFVFVKLFGLDIFE